MEATGTVTTTTVEAVKLEIVLTGAEFQLLKDALMNISDPSSEQWAVFEELRDDLNGVVLATE